MRLASFVLTAVVCCMAAADLIWSVPAYIVEYHRVHQDAETTTRKLFRAAIDPNVFPTLQYEADIIKRLTDLSDIAGGRIEDTAGEPLATIQEAPNLTVLQAQRSKISSLESSDDRFLDVFIGVEDSQLAHPVVLRIDLQATYSLLLRRYIEGGLRIVVVAAVGCVGVFLALYPILFRPLALIRDAVLRGVRDQDVAQNFQIKWKRADELGTLAVAINRLLQVASKNYEETLHTSFEVWDKSPVATMAYLSTGELSFANPAALALFNAEDLESLAEMNQKFLKVKAAASPHADPISIEEALADGPFADEGTILTPDGPRLVICMGTTTYREDGSVRRYVAQFLDAETAIQRISRLEAAIELASERRIAAERRALSLRGMLESCTIIMQDGNLGDKKQIVVPVDATLKQWAQTAARVGKARRVLYNRLPTLNGSPTLIPMLFRQALGYMDFRSEYRNSEFRIIGKNDSGMVTFEFSETVADTTTERETNEVGSEQEIGLTLAAVTKLVQACGGSIRHSKDEALKFDITLPRIMHSFAEDGEGGVAA